MYIRIQDNCIRYRVSRDEANQLARGKTFQSSLALSPSHTLIYGINTTLESSRFEFDSNTNGLQLFINHDELRAEVEGRPSKRGLVFSQPFSEKNISVSLEINLKRE